MRVMKTGIPLMHMQRSSTYMIERREISTLTVACAPCAVPKHLVPVLSTSSLRALSELPSVIDA